MQPCFLGCASYTLWQDTLGSTVGIVVIIIISQRLYYCYCYQYYYHYYYYHRRYYYYYCYYYYLRLNCMGVVPAALRDTIREYYIKVANNEALGGLPADNGWVLRGLQNDTMGLHEFLAMNISRGAGWWAPRNQYIEVCCADKDHMHPQQDNSMVRFCKSMLWHYTCLQCNVSVRGQYCDSGCANRTKVHHLLALNTHERILLEPCDERHVVEPCRGGMLQC